MTEGNALFLICQPCQETDEPDYGVKLAARTERSWYAHEVPGKQLDQWLEKHRHCAGRGKPDHFVLGHRFNRNHDQDALAPAVKLAMVK